MMSQYKDITGDDPPVNHGINKCWYNCLLKNTIGWSPKKVYAFAGLFKKGTSIDRQKRFKTIEEFLKNINFQAIISKK